MLFDSKKKQEPLQVEDVDMNITTEMQLKINEHEEICKYIHNLYRTKNRDYGDSMHPLYEEYGLTAFMVLFSIKISRIKSLMEKGSAKYESLEDSLMDLANYALIAVTELRAEKKLKGEVNVDGVSVKDLFNGVNTLPTINFDNIIDHKK